MLVLSPDADANDNVLKFVINGVSEDEIRVAFYGDYHFRPENGDVSVPAKAILKRCGGLVAATS